MTKLRKPLVQRSKQRAGLQIYERVSIDAADSSAEASEAISHVLQSASLTGRLTHIKEGARRHPDDALIREEVSDVEELLQACNGNPQTWDAFDRIDAKLKALERGIALLDTGRYLDDVLVAIKYREVQSNKAKEERRSITTDTGKVNKKDLVERALIDAHPEDSTPAVWPHLYSVLDGLGLEPQEAGAKDCAEYRFRDLADKPKHHTMTWKGVQLILGEIKREKGATPKRGRPKKKPA